MVLSQRMSTRSRWMFKLFPFLFEKCPHGNIGRKKKMTICYCMISSSDGSKWSFAIALKTNDKWLAVQEIRECEDCEDPVPAHRLMNKVCKDCYKPTTIAEIKEIID